MASFVTRYGVLNLTIPNQTPTSAPVSALFNPGDMILKGIDLTIPSGPSGYAGIQWLVDGNTIIPFDQPGEWIISDDAKIHFEFDDEVGSGIQVQGYNTDMWDHTFYMIFAYQLISVASFSGATNVLSIA